MFAFSISSTRVHLSRLGLSWFAATDDVAQSWARRVLFHESQWEPPLPFTYCAYPILQDNYTRTAQAFLIVFSITSRSSFEEAKTIYDARLNCNNATRDFG
jgi:hypothetical protein